MTLKDKVVFLTGASQGIGQETALFMAGQGAKLALAARSAEKLAAIENDIKQSGGEALAVPMDVADEAAIKAAVKQAAGHFGQIDVLVNNAAITRDQLQMRMKRADWDAVIETNLTGAHLCAQAVIPGMLKRRSGRIINITSVVAQAGNPGQANYIASKAGLIGLTKALAAELGSRSITVNAVAPGFIDTAMTASLPEKVREEMRARIPLGRLGAPRDVAAAVAFLASEEAAYITGHILNVNGGMFMG